MQDAGQSFEPKVFIMAVGLQTSDLNLEGYFSPDWLFKATLDFLFTAQIGQLRAREVNVLRKEGTNMTTIDMYILTPLREMFSTVLSFIPTLVSVFIILFLGYLLAKLLREVLQRLFKTMRLDKVADKLELPKMLHTGGVKHGVSHVLNGVVYLIVVLMFLIMALRVINIDTASDSIGIMLAYAAHVVSAVFMLIIGLIVAQVVGKIVYLVVANLEMPNPKLVERISRWAIVLYAARMCISELGFGYLLSGTEFRILFAGIVLALALAFGLGGRDAAAKYLSRK
jgi:small-conductance mechanosensitive channel